jgi:hypothetical protein
MGRDTDTVSEDVSTVRGGEGGGGGGTVEEHYVIHDVAAKREEEHNQLGIAYMEKHPLVFFCLEYSHRVNRDVSESQTVQDCEHPAEQSSQ